MSHCEAIPYLSQETLQYLWICRVELSRNFCGISTGFPRSHERISAESSKGIHEIVKGYLRNRQRISADLFKGISAVRIIKGVCRIAQMITVESSYCIPRIVEG